MENSLTGRRDRECRDEYRESTEADQSYDGVIYIVLPLSGT
jgi:hypothetical protein